MYYYNTEIRHIYIEVDPKVCITSSLANRVTPGTHQPRHKHEAQIQKNTNQTPHYRSWKTPKHWAVNLRQVLQSLVPLLARVATELVTFLL